VVDRHAPNGPRNYAMLLLVATYGLRSCEVRALRLDDIHLRARQRFLPGRDCGEGQDTR